MLGLVLALAGCAGMAPPPGATVSFGHTSEGYLRGGVQLPVRGEGFVRARPGDETYFGTPSLVHALVRAAGDVARRHPGTEPLRIADLSWPGGGRHPRHRSHRSGRDADVIFYVLDGAGRSAQGRGWLGFDRFGVARDPREGGVYYYDDARNWAFVRSLLTDPDAGVQWIFCSRGVKARLLDYGVRTEEDPEVLFRASWVLQQPGNARPHHDHFHIRVACTSAEVAAGCVNTGPVWPWLRDGFEKPADPEDGGEAVTDESLVAWLMDDAGAEPQPGDTRIAVRAPRP
jgi:penicillin-insensitive murein endopeptidase